MDITYIKPYTELVRFNTEGLLYTASPQQGSDDDGTLPIQAKPLTIENIDNFPEDDEGQEIATLPHFNIWED